MLRRERKFGQLTDSVVSVRERAQMLMELRVDLAAEGGSGPAEVFVAARPSRWTRR